MTARVPDPEWKLIDEAADLLRGSLQDAVGIDATVRSALVWKPGEEHQRRLVVVDLDPGQAVTLHAYLDAAIGRDEVTAVVESIVDLHQRAANGPYCTCGDVAPCPTLRLLTQLPGGAS